MKSNEDSKSATNPKNPEVVPATPDVDTADLVREAGQATASATTDAPSTPADTPSLSQPPSPSRVERSSSRRFYFAFGLLTVIALVAAGALAYYFFYASSTVEVVLHSEPIGAKVLLDGKEVGTSPVTVTVKPGIHTVIFVQKGFQTFQQTVQVQFDGTVIEQKLIPLTPQP